MILQKIEYQPNATERYVLPGNFWYDVFTIFTNILIPIIIVTFLMYAIVKFYKMLNKMNSTLEDLNETLNRK